MKKTLLTLSLVTSFAQAATQPVTYVCSLNRPGVQVEVRAMPGAGTRCGRFTFVQAEGRVAGKGFRFGTCASHFGGPHPRGAHVFNALPAEEGQTFVDTLAIDDIELHEGYSFQAGKLNLVVNGETLPEQALICRFE